MQTLYTGTPLNALPIRNVFGLLFPLYKTPALHEYRGYRISLQGWRPDPAATTANSINVQLLAVC